MTVLVFSRFIYNSCISSCADDSTKGKEMDNESLTSRMFLGVL